MQSAMQPIDGAMASLTAAPVIQQVMNGYGFGAGATTRPQVQHALALSAQLTHAVLHTLAPGHPVIAAIDGLWASFATLGAQMQTPPFPPALPTPLPPNG